VRLTNLEMIRLRASSRTTHLLVELGADDGRTGLGDGSIAASDMAVAAAAQELFRETLVGQPVEAIARLIDEVRRRTGGDPDINRATAASALEHALWDLRGQEVGLPVWALLGGRRRERISLYANVNRGIVDRSPESFARHAAAAVEAGFRGVKCAPFDGVRPETSRERDTQDAISLGIRRVEAVRGAVGGEVGLMVDCHGRFDFDTAVEVAERLRGSALFWLEEPVATHPYMRVVTSPRSAEVRFDGGARDPEYGRLRDVAAATSIPLAAGEFFFGIDQFEDLLATDALGFLMPDVKHCGGLWETVRIGAVAEARGVGIAPHNPAGALGTLAAAHVCAALVSFDWLELQWLEMPWRAELLEPPELISSGALLLPDGPGLGARLNGRTVAAHRIALDE
jgi:galactonate dehydratase